MKLITKYQDSMILVLSTKFWLNYLEIRVQFFNGIAYNLRQKFTRPVKTKKNVCKRE